ncbi:MAG: hypothetical protein L6W00_05695 [Lentisphaeria bacterium]|nr:MAG: hypothetical protein L6W00_05695 [Lentisphaeria bacterium]
MIVLAVLVVGSGYLYSLRLTAPAEVPGIATLVPAEGIHLGSTVRASVELELPLFRRVNKVVAEPGDGATLVGEPEIDRGGWRWSRQVWRIAAELRPFRPGTVQPGVLTLELSPEKSGGEPVLFTVTIPDFFRRCGEGRPQCGTAACRRRHRDEIGCFEPALVAAADSGGTADLVPVAPPPETGAGTAAVGEGDARASRAAGRTARPPDSAGNRFRAAHRPGAQLSGNPV